MNKDLLQQQLKIFEGAMAPLDPPVSRSLHCRVGMHMKMCCKLKLYEREIFNVSTHRQKRSKFDSELNMRKNRISYCFQIGRKGTQQEISKFHEIFSGKTQRKNTISYDFSCKKRKLSFPHIFFRENIYFRLSFSFQYHRKSKDILQW